MAKSPKPKSSAPARAADPADVAEFCAKNDAAEIAAELIREGATMDEVRERVGAIAKIRQMVRDACSIAPTALKPELADHFIARGMTVADVRKALFDKLTEAQSPEIRNAVGTDVGDPGAAARRGWEKAVAAVANPKNTEVWR